MKRYFFIKLFTVILFLIMGYMICDRADDFFPSVTYGKDEVRVVIDNREVTKSLPNRAVIKNDAVFLSFDTVKKYFDPYLYFDEKYQTVIITNAENVMKLKIDDRMIRFNGEEKQVQNPATKSGEVIYLPMEEIKEMLDIDVDYQEKIVVSTKDTNYQDVKMSKKGSVKLKKKELSGSTGKYLIDDILRVYPSGDNEEYVKVRTANGSLGYVKNEYIKEGTVVSNYQVPPEEHSISRKINLTWDLAGNQNTGDKIEGLNVISPMWIFMKNSSGDVSNTISTYYISWADQMGYELWPMVKNDNMGPSRTSELVKDMEARETFINQVVSLAKQYQFPGINLDFENMKRDDSGDYTEFVRELSADLRRNGILVSVDVGAPDGSENYSQCFNRTDLSKCVDYVVLMGYDQYGQRSDGPSASLEWVERSIKKMVENEQVPSEKLILGVPFYTKYIKQQETTSGDEMVYQTIGQNSLFMGGGKKYLNAYQNYTVWDDKMKQYYIEYRSGNTIEKCWVEEEKSLAEKVKLVDKYHLTGVASWAKGMETNSAWEVIFNNVEGL